jgi:hypothetical protein
MCDIIIQDSTLIEATLSDLHNNTVSNFDTPRQTTAGRVQVTQKIFNAMPRNSIVGVTAKTRSSAKEYVTRMLFSNIEYVEEEGVDTSTFTSADGTDYVVGAMGYRDNDVKVGCNCLDFYYRFAVWNSKEGSLLGSVPPPYVKKTDSEPANPNQVSGMCKHLIALTDELKRERFLK